MYEVQASAAQRPLDELVATALATYPGGTPTFVSVHPPLATDEPAMVMMKNGFGAGSGPWIRAHVDPYTGAVLASFAPDSNFPGFIAHLHAHLAMGEHGRGEQIVGAAGIVLLVFCVTGIVMWWPGARRLRRSMRVRTGKHPIVLHYDLHRVAGLVFLVPLLIVALTGVVLVFPEYTKAPLVRAFDLPRPPRGPQASGAGVHVTLEQVRALLAREFAAERLVSVQLPGSRNGIYQARLLLPGDARMRYGGGAKRTVWMDAATGRILRTHESAAAPVLARLLFEWIFPAHTGDIAGEAGRALAFVTSLLPPGLFVTGIVVWQGKRSRRRSSRACRIAEEG